MIFKKNIAKTLLCMVCLMVFSVVGVHAQSSTYQVKENTVNESFLQGKYPEIIKADSVLTKVKINTEIEKTVSKFAEGIRARQAKGEELKGYVGYEIKTPLGESILQSSRRGSYTVNDIKTNDEGLFSILITCSTMYKGAAHPSSYTYGLTFDAEGNLVNLNQVLAKDKSLYTVDNLKTAVYAQAKDKLYSGDTFSVEINKFPKEFYVDSDDNLHFLFQQYEIAPYAAGVIDIVLK